MTKPRINPDTTARVFELIHAYADGQTDAAGEIVRLIPSEELTEVAAFALGMLGSLYRLDETARDAPDQARRGSLKSGK
jgi:hypothetical protein